jgi:ribose transport system substrate-binding protein
VILLLVAAAGCNRNTARRVGMVPKGRAHIFWQSVHAGAVKAAREKKIDLVWNGPTAETDFTGEVQIVDSMINQHMDAIALAPVDRKALVSVVERAAAVGIPVVIFDSPIDTENFTAQVATDNYHAGAIAAQRMIEILSGKGKVAIVATQAGAASTMAREKGFEDAIHAKAPGIQIVDKRYGNSDFAQALAVSENMLTAYPDLDAFFASNESSAVGAAQALESRHSKVKLVGFDSSPSLLEGLKSGAIDSLVVQDPFRMGYDTVISVVEKLDGGAPKKIQNIDPLVVTRENLDNPAVHDRLFPDLNKYLN